MRPVIFYRLREFEKEEKTFAEKAGWFCTKYITDIKPGDFVWPRYSAMLYGLPELQHDLKTIGAKILQNSHEYEYIRDLRNYYEDLYDYTPKTWFELSDIPNQGPFVLKGETSSKKFCWDTHCFAKDKKEAIEVYLRLLDDGYLSGQNIYIRKFEPLKTFMIAPRGLPITNEYRFFILNGKIMAKGYYWSNSYDDLIEQGIHPDINEVPESFIQTIIQTIGLAVKGFVMDIAQKENGDWILIELNSLEQSGLSLCDPTELYTNVLKEVEQGII